MFSGNIFRRWIFAWLAMAVGLCAAWGQEAFGPTGLALWGDSLLVAGAQSKALAQVNLSNGKIERILALPAAPSGVAVDEDSAYITAGMPHGKLVIVDLKKWKIARELSAGHSPMSPVLNGDVLYVADRFAGQILRFDKNSGNITARWEAIREPVALAVSPKDGALWVANLLPTGAANGNFIGAQVCVFKDGKRTCIALPNGAHSVRGIAASSDGRYVAAAHVLSRYGLPTTQVDKGWMNTNAFTLFDAATHEAIATVLLDDSDLGAANPWAVAFSGNGKTLYITHAGAGEMSAIDLPALLAKIEKEGKIATERDLGFLRQIRQRVELHLEGPRTMAVSGKGVYIGGYFSDEIAFWAPGQTQAHLLATLGDGLRSDPRRRGEAYFNDARLCFQQWQSCVSCHPDGRADGLNWDLLNDGMGNPKNTRSLLLSHRTPPVMALAVRANAEKAVRSGFKYIQFVVPEESRIKEVDAYLRDVRPIPGPFLSPEPLQIQSEGAQCAQCHAPEVGRGKLTEKARKGKEIFKKAGCAVCHPHPYFTDMQQHEVGTATGIDTGRKIDTPSLIEVWRTAPYLHDGRAATLEQAVFEMNPHGLRGRTEGLNAEEKSALIEYLKSL